MQDHAQIAWPVKSRELHNHHMNSAVWNDFKFRGGDVVIVTYAKSGTTWTQQIVLQLIFEGAEGIDVSKLSPWVDLRIMPPEAIAGLEAQTHRRFVKTHLPVDALVFSPAAKYIYIARDGRDMVWSLYNHFANAKPALYDAFNNTPGRVGPPIDYMKAHAVHSAPLGGAVWEGGAGTFLNKGTNGRWHDTLTPAEIRAYESRAIAELGVDCAAWLEMAAT